MEQMLLEELRRTREGNDRLSTVVSSIEKTLAVMGSEHAHTVGELGKIQARMDVAEGDIEKLRSWRDRQEGARGLAGWLINSPVIGWIVAAAAAGWAILQGKGHP